MANREKDTKGRAKRKSTIMGGRNPKNIESMIAAGIITREEGNTMKRKSKGKKKSLLSIIFD